MYRELDWITMKALEKDRTRRYETVNGLARDLQRFLYGGPVEAGPASMSYRLGKLVRKYRVWLSAVAAILSAVLIGAIVSVWMAFRASEAEQVARAVSEFLESDLLPRPARTHRPSPVTSRS